MKTRGAAFITTPKRFSSANEADGKATAKKRNTNNETPQKEKRQTISKLSSGVTSVTSKSEKLVTVRQSTKKSQYAALKYESRQLSDVKDCRNQASCSKLQEDFDEKEEDSVLSKMKVVDESDDEDRSDSSFEEGHEGEASRRATKQRSVRDISYVKQKIVEAAKLWQDEQLISVIQDLVCVYLKSERNPDDEFLPCDCMDAICKGLSVLEVNYLPNIFYIMAQVLCSDDIDSQKDMFKGVDDMVSKYGFGSGKEYEAISKSNQHTRPLIEPDDTVVSCQKPRSKALLEIDKSMPYGKAAYNINLANLIDTILPPSTNPVSHIKTKGVKDDSMEVDTLTNSDNDNQASFSCIADVKDPATEHDSSEYQSSRNNQKHLSFGNANTSGHIQAKTDSTSSNVIDQENKDVETLEMLDSADNNHLTMGEKHIIYVFPDEQDQNSAFVQSDTSANNLHILQSTNNSQNGSTSPKMQLYLPRSGDTSDGQQATDLVTYTVTNEQMVELYGTNSQTCTEDHLNDDSYIPINCESSKQQENNVIYMESGTPEDSVDCLVEGKTEIVGYSGNDDHTVELCNPQGAICYAADTGEVDEVIDLGAVEEFTEVAVSVEEVELFTSDGNELGHLEIIQKVGRESEAAESMLVLSGSANQEQEEQVEQEEQNVKKESMVAPKSEKRPTLRRRKKKGGEEVDEFVCELLLDNEGAFRCLLCEQVLPIEDKAGHYIEQHQEQQVRCDVDKCGVLFYAEESLARHKQLHHGPLHCQVCGRGFTSRQSLIRHQLLHENKRMFSCEICNKGFNCRTKLGHHKLLAHKGIKPFMCDLCGAGFTTNHSLKEHRNKHTGDRPYKCPLCPKTFARFNLFSKHKTMAHGNLEVTCHICGSSFSHPYTLNRHIKLVHKQGNAPVNSTTCDICGKVLGRKWDLRKHIEIVHEGRRDHECHICHKRFTMKGHLVEHLPVHNRQARFRCDLCGEGFIHRATFKAHMFRHTQGQKPLNCPICVKTFDLPTHLQRHMKRVHPGVTVELPKSVCKMPASSLLPQLRATAATQGQDQEEVREKGQEQLRALPQLGTERPRAPSIRHRQQPALTRAEATDDVAKVDGSHGDRQVEIEVSGERRVMYVPAGISYVQLEDQIVYLNDQ